MLEEDKALLKQYLELYEEFSKDKDLKKKIHTFSMINYLEKRSPMFEGRGKHRDIQHKAHFRRVGVF